MSKKIKITLSVIIPAVVLCLLLLPSVTENIKLNKMRKIEEGTSYNQIVELFGEPDKVVGSGFLIVAYEFKDTTMVLNFMGNNKLQMLSEIKSNGEEKVYFPLGLTD